MEKHGGSPFVFWIIAVLSVLSSWLITPNDFPHTGLSIGLIAVSTLFYFLKKPKTFFHTGVYASSVALSLFLILRANPILHLLDIVAIIVLTCILVDNINTYTFTRLLASPIKNLDAFFSTQNRFTHKGMLKTSHKEALKRVNYIQIAVSVAVTIILLAFIIPLLGSANPIFDKFIKNLLEALNIEKIFQSINVVRLILSVVFFVIISRLATYVHVQEQAPSQERTSLIQDAILILPKIIVSLVIFIFAIAQFQLYFASDELLKSLNYTNAKLTQEVFAQLSVVSIIVFLLIYGGQNKSKLSRIFDYILIVEGLFLTFVGLKSDYDYSEIYGFTQKRLYGFAAIFWIFGAYLLYVLNHVRKLKTSTFVSHFILFSSLTLILINIANFDSLIYRYKKAVGGKIDYEYMSTLSPDSGHHKDAVIYLENMTKKHGKDLSTWPDTQGFRPYDTIRTIEDLKKKYKNPDLRIFNLSEYKTYQLVKDAYLPQLSRPADPALSQKISSDQYFLDIDEARKLFDKGDYKVALEKATSALSYAKNNKHKAEAHIWIGLIYHRQQNRTAAESEFQLARKLDPTNGEPYLRLSIVEMDRVDFQEALEHAKKCSEFSPTNAWCENFQGLALIQLGRIDEGVKHLEKAVSLEPDVYAFRENLARFKIKK